MGSKHSIGDPPTLIPASPDCGTPEPDSAAPAALESFAGIPRGDDVPALVASGQTVHDVSPGREEVLAVLDALKHPVDVSFAHLALGLLR